MASFINDLNQKDQELRGEGDEGKKQIFSDPSEQQKDATEKIMRR